ncbi:serine hydrolase [Altererythrobacter luteolus]|uniref:Beta-lactamase n=1 Tax=Pontixanthobacter luteolus TaxID=295089 RepID=A0A6I4V1U9_9SPHN|nr:serine hydrolase [Pontixanthobacter luteolus]MXP48137.1 serine hydrolase [Pontixanthobacter luteolus]
MRSGLGILGRFGFAAALGLTALAPAQAQTANFESAFDRTFGTEPRAPQTFDAVYESSFERQLAKVADGDQGRIGVSAIDLTTGYQVSVLGDQRFPMASTSKVAIAATFLAGVDQGRWSLTSEFPLLIPVKSGKYSSPRAPVREGTYLPAEQLLNLMISKSSNASTDALLRVVGGPQAVNAWMRRAGIDDFELSRDIATLVRDDGEVDPATRIDNRDSATPNAMAKLLAGLYQGKWLSRSSRDVLIGAMENTTTGKRRIRSALPMSANVAHKTGTLNRMASDIGIFETPDGRAIAIAIYVTGQSLSSDHEAMNKREARRKRDERIANIARALYNGFSSQSARNWVNAEYKTGG